MAYKKLERRAPMLAALALVVALIAWACSASTSQAQSNISGTLNFASSASSARGWTAVINAFEKAYPNVDVKPNFIPIASYNTLITTQLQAGNAPDVFFGALGSAYPTSLRVLAAKGQIADLSNTTTFKKLPANFQKSLTYKGKGYALPMGGWSGFWVYNLDKFNELGIKPPTTWKELLNLCGTIAGKGYIPAAIGPTTGDLGNFYSLLAASMVDGPEPKWLDKRNANHATFQGSKGWHNVLQGIVDMKNRKCFTDGVAGTSRDAAYASFFSQKALMLPILQNQMAAVLAAKPSFKYSEFATPGIKAEDRTMFATLDPVLSVNKNSKNMAAAMAFVEFATKPAQTQGYAKVMGIMSLDQFEKKQVPAYMKHLNKYLFKKANPPILMTSRFKSPSTYFSVLSSGLPGLLTGQTNVNGLLKQLDDTYGKPS